MALLTCSSEITVPAGMMVVKVKELNNELLALLSSCLVSSARNAARAGRARLQAVPAREAPLPDPGQTQKVIFSGSAGSPSVTVRLRQR